MVAMGMSAFARGLYSGRYGVSRGAFVIKAILSATGLCN